MWNFFRHRRDGLARVSLALGIVVITLLMQYVPQATTETAEAGPSLLQTRHAQFSKCTVGQKETKVGKFGCAVLLKPKIPSSSITFLSSEGKSDDLALVQIKK